MTLQNIMDLELNAEVSYAGFKSLLFKGKDERYVILEDKHGDTKKDLYRIIRQTWKGNITKSSLVEVRDHAQRGVIRGDK